VKGGDLVLAPKLKQPHRPDLYLLSSATGPNARGNIVSATRLRLRIWERRRLWAGRALIALSFPMAYLLMMLATGTPAPIAAVRIVIAAWAVTLAVSLVCAEATWRHRFRLEGPLSERNAPLP
jgi:hypothetical protein